MGPPGGPFRLGPGAKCPSCPPLWAALGRPCSISEEGDNRVLWQLVRAKEGLAKWISTASETSQSREINFCEVHSAKILSWAVGEYPALGHTKSNLSFWSPARIVNLEP